MTEKEKLQELINKPHNSSIYDWMYEVKEFLEQIGEYSKDAKKFISGIEHHQNVFKNGDKLTAYLKHLYTKKYEGIEIPPIKKRNQIFVAMMFSEETDRVYSDVYEPVIQSLNYSAMRIDKKEFLGSIINEITSEITDSVALIADLTGNRGGVYYEAGIAKGLQMCNHPIKLVLTCHKTFFDNEGVHFDLKGDNIIIYNDDNELKERLNNRLTVLLKGGNNDQT